MITAKSQQRLGNALLLAFVAGVVGLWLSAPVKALFAEHVLANVGYGEAGFSDSFGALPVLVKDNGGAQPVPIEAAAPQRIAQYRDKDWLMTQDATSYTLQVAVFADERRIGDLLSARRARGGWGPALAGAAAAGGAAPMPIAPSRATSGRRHPPWN